MDEQNKPITQQASASVPDYSNEINAMYDAQKQSQLSQLEGAYNQNVSTMQGEKAKIAPLYNTQANDLATQYERTRRNNNFRADLNGLNTGTASQMDLAQQGNYLKGYGQLRASQAEAERAVDQRIADLEIDYKNAVAQAIASNDYQRATALLDEYKRRDAEAKDESRYQYQIRTAEQQYQDKMAQQALENQRYMTEWEYNTNRQAEQDAFARQQYEDKLAQQAIQNQRYDTEWAQQLRQYEDQLAQQQLQNQRYDTEWAAKEAQRELENQRYDTQYGDNQALNNAKLRAAYGDFGGYETLYGKETADAMREFWIQANPNYAYANGLISEDTYNKLLGIVPNSGGGSSGYSSSGYSSGSRGGGSSNTGTGAEGFSSTAEQLVMQGVPYADAVKMVAENATSISEYNEAKQILDKTYQSTWAGKENAGLYNVAGNDAETRGSKTWERPTGVQPTTTSYKQSDDKKIEQEKNTKSNSKTWTQTGQTTR